METLEKQINELLIQERLKYYRKGWKAALKWATSIKQEMLIEKFDPKLGDFQTFVDAVPVDVIEQELNENT